MVNYGGGNAKILVSPSGDMTGNQDWAHITNAMNAVGAAGGALTGTPYNLNGAAAYVKFDSNPGINPAGTQSIAVPATTVATAALPFDATFYITASALGGVTVAISGGPTVTIPAAGVVPVLVPAGQTLTPTYVDAPTWVVEGN